MVGDEAVTDTMDELRDAVRGPVVRVGGRAAAGKSVGDNEGLGGADDRANDGGGYDGAHDGELAGFQLGHPHRPEFLVGATSADDVRAAVNFARAHGSPIAVQSTGHGRIQPIDGGILINTGRMLDIRVDESARIARVAAGARWSDVIAATAPFGLAPLSGSFPGVGVVGYLLGGGMGLLGRRYGFAADHVIAIELVTADGEFRRVTGDAEPELFWALRGGAGNFGVVTAVEISLFPMPLLYGGSLTFDAAAFGSVVPAWRDWTTTVPREMTSAVTLVPFTMPDIPVIPAPLRGRRTVGVQLAYAGSAAEGVKLIDDLRSALPEPLLDTVSEVPYTESGSIFAEPDTPRAYASEGILVTELETRALAELTTAVSEPAVPSIVGIRHLGGAFSDQPEVANAISHRGAKYALSALSMVDPGEDERIRSAHLSLLEPFRERTLGRILNFSDGTHDADDVRQAYDSATYEKLTAIKTAVDPTNLFRHNHNIPPASPGQPG